MNWKTKSEHLTEDMWHFESWHFNIFVYAGSHNTFKVVFLDKSGEEYTKNFRRSLYEHGKMTMREAEGYARKLHACFRSMRDKTWTRIYKMRLPA
jgi:hypothetical protein